MYQETMAATSMAETLALRGLAAAADTSAADEAETAEKPPSFLASGLGGGVGFGAVDGRLSGAEQSAGQGPRPFLVFNPTVWDRREVVEATVWDNAPPGAVKPLRERTFAVRSPDGRIAAAQVVKGGAYWGHDYATVAFAAAAPALGYAVYTVIEAAAEKSGDEARQLGHGHHCRYSMYERSGEGMENEFVRVELDPATGGILSLVDKRSGAELIRPERPAAPLEFLVERPHSMTSWLIEHGGPVETPLVTGLRRGLAGPLKATIEADLRIRESEFTLTYELRAGDPRLYVHVQGTWFQRGTKETGVPVLRLALPLALEQPEARYEMPFGAVKRDLPGGEEVPALEWALVTGRSGERRAGLLLLNDSKHGHSFAGGTLRLTLIRGSYAPDPLPEIGRHEVHLALAPVAGDVTVAEATRTARELNHGLRVAGTDVHKGGMPSQARLLAVGPENVVLSGLKKAEEGEALIVRVYETAGRETLARIEPDGQWFGKPAEAAEVDLMERPLAGSTARIEDGAVTVKVPAFGIATVSIALKRRHGRG